MRSPVTVSLNLVVTDFDRSFFSYCLNSVYSLYASNTSSAKVLWAAKVT